MTHDVFISFSTEDKAIADAACAILEARRIRCWIAPRDVQPGIPYPQSIMEGIRGSRVLVLILSAKSNISKHVMREVERAVNCEIPIVPLRIDGVSLSGSLEYLVGPVHWIDALTPPMERHLETLARVVQTLLADLHGGKTSARPPHGGDGLTRSDVDSAPATSETGPTRSTMADDNPKGSRQHAAVSRSARTREGPSTKPSEVPESLGWRNPGLTSILGILNLLAGLAVLIVSTWPFRSLSDSLDIKTYILKFGIITLMMPVLQVIGAFGLWNTRRWGGWLAGFCAGFFSLAGLLRVLIVGFSGSSTCLCLNIPIILFHLLLRPKIVARRSVAAANPAEQYPQPHS